MAKRPVLVVVVVQDPALRSALAGQLALSGINLLTAESFDSDLIERRLIRQPSILIVDESGIEGDQGMWIEQQWLDRAWDRVMALTLEAPLLAGDSEWLVYLDKNAPARDIAGRIIDLAGPVEQVPVLSSFFEVETFGNA